MNPDTKMGAKTLAALSDLADPKSGPCPFFKLGDNLLLKRTPKQNFMNTADDAYTG